MLFICKKNPLWNRLNLEKRLLHESTQVEREGYARYDYQIEGRPLTHADTLTEAEEILKSNQARIDKAIQLLKEADNGADTELVAKNYPPHPLGVPTLSRDLVTTTRSEDEAAAQKERETEAQKALNAKIKYVLKKYFV